MKQSTFSAVMANSIKNLLQRYTKGIRFVAVLTVLLTMGIGEAWADNCGFWGDGAASITIAVNGTNKTPADLNSNGVTDFELGTVTTSLTIKSAWAKVWGRDQFNGIKLYYRVKGKDASSSAAYSNVSLSWDNNFNSNDQFWQNTSINKTISINLAPGDYEIEYYFMADAKSESDKYLSNGSGNYHANFTIPSKKLTVSGAANGNTVSGTVTGITKGKAYTIKATPTTGYSFSKWTASSGASSITIANPNAASTTVTFKDYANDATVTASFSAITSAVTLDANGGTGGTTSVTATYGQAMPKVTDLPTREGYNFNGYFDAASGGTQYYKDDGTSAQNWDKTAATILYAQWSQITYTVKWVVDGQEKATESVAHGSKPDPNQAPAMDPNNPICGDRFVGWTSAPIEGQLESAPATLYPTAADIPEITDETTFYAVFADYEK